MTFDYISAMHGEPFYQSGKRAVTLLCRNILNVIMINVVVNYVVAMVILIPIIITGAIAYGIFQVSWTSFTSTFLGTFSIEIYLLHEL